MFALYASLSRLTSVRSDSGRFDSFVMERFSPWYVESQRVLRGSGCAFALIGPVIGPAGSLPSSGVWAGLGVGVGAGTSFVCARGRVDDWVFDFSLKLVVSSRLKTAAAVAVRKLSVARARVCGACA